MLFLLAPSILQSTKKRREREYQTLNADSIVLNLEA
jgi:hypothetical protein